MNAASVSSLVEAKVSGTNDPYTEAEDGNSTSSDTYVYNGDGQRVKKVEAGITTKYYYSGSVVLYTADEDNNKISGNIATPNGEIIASRDSKTGGSGAYYYFFHYDLRGSVTSILKQDGTFEQGYSYDEFGNTIEANSSSSFTNEISYTGAISDSTTGLSYMNARYYNPATGSFTSQDTYYGNAYIPSTQHLYSYTGGNPINFIDPTGHSLKSLWESVTNWVNDAVDTVASWFSASESKAAELIKDNRENIINAGNEYGVDPQTVAVVIYTEQAQNVDWVDFASDWLGATGLMNTSIGLGQIRVSTARKIENAGYIEKTPHISFLTDTAKDSYSYNVSMKLIDNQTNCRYVAAYLKYFQDRWIKEYPAIANDPYILATLYNQDELKSPHPNPVPSEPFGIYAGNNYDYMGDLLK